MMEMSEAAEWLRNEDSVCFDDRLTRLESISDKLPSAQFLTFPGGLLAKSLFEEMRYCFVYAQFLATIFLGLAYIERTLASLFYGAGRNDLQRAGLSELLREALAEGLVDSREFESLERIRMNRNSYAHFRKPGHEDGVEYRALTEGDVPYGIIERDAVTVVVAAFHIVDKDSI